jgi:hypothetical protein
MATPREPRPSQFLPARCPRCSRHATAISSTASGCANQREESLQNSDHENLVVSSRSTTPSTPTNTVWYRFQQDTGLQAAYTDPINVHLQLLFSAAAAHAGRRLHAHLPFQSRQPVQSRRKLVLSIFEPNNFAQVQQTFPIVLAAGSNQAPFTTIGGNDNTYPQGRKVTQWQINDNLDWIRGKQEYRFGINTRRIDVSDYDLGEGSVPTAVYNDLAEFTYGAAYTESQTFPISFKERVAAGNLDLYAMDTYKPTPQSHVHRRRASDLEHRSRESTAPVRAPGRIVSRSLAQHQPAARSGHSNRGANLCFPPRRLLVWQPRVSLAYQVAPGTVVHLGFGVFNDIIPAQIADLAATNAPYAPTFVGGIGGQVGGIAIAPGVANSAAGAAVSANRQFQSLFSAGAPPCAESPLARPVCPLAVSLNTFPTGTLKTPYYYQYNFGIEQKLERARRRPHRLCRHARPPRAVSGRPQRLPDGLRRMLCALPLPAAARPAIRQRQRIPHRRQQQLLRPADQPLRAAPLSHPQRKLHIQPLPRRSLQRRLAPLFHAGHSHPAARRAKPPIQQLRLRCAPQHLRLRHLPDSFCIEASSVARSVPRLVVL